MQQEQQFDFNISLLSLFFFHIEQRMLDTLQQQSQYFTCQTISNFPTCHTSRQLKRYVLTYLFDLTMVSKFMIRTCKHRTRSSARLQDRVRQGNTTWTAGAGQRVVTVSTGNPKQLHTGCFPLHTGGFDLRVRNARHEEQKR